MDRIDEHKYFVVKFLENPFKYTERASCEHVCVPKSWLEWQSREENIVRVWYPTFGTPRTIEKRVRKAEKKSDQWVSALAVLKYSTYIYEDAKIYIKRKKYSDTKNKEDCTPLSAMMEEETSKTTSSVHKNEATVNNMPDALGCSISSKSAKTTVKRSAPADFDKTAHCKRSKVNEPDESVDEVAGPSSQAFELSRNNQRLIHKKSNDRNSTEKIENLKKNDSKANQSLDPKSVDQLLADKCCKLLEELQKYLGTSLVQEIFNKIMKTDNSRSVLTNDTNTSTSIVTTALPPKSNEEKRNEEQTADNNCDDDESEDNDENDYNNKLHGTKCPQIVPPKYDDANGSKEDDLDDVGGDDERRKIKKCPRDFILPPEYDANDSRWTLKYREPAPGLVELMEHSGVYVNASRLKDCINSEKLTYLLGGLLLSEIFTSSALSTCSFTGRRAPGTSGINTRPGLDEHAREVLLEFLEDHGKGYQGKEMIMHIINKKMLNMRRNTAKNS